MGECGAGFIRAEIRGRARGDSKALPTCAGAGMAFVASCDKPTSIAEICRRARENRRFPAFRKQSHSRSSAPTKVDNRGDIKT